MIGKSVEQAAKHLLQGDLVGIPTESVYGLAGNALNLEAIAKIYSVKDRPQFNPLILHTHSLDTAFQYTTQLSTELTTLADAYWPGSLSLLVPKSDLVPDVLTAGSPDVVIRVPHHTMTLDLLKSLPFPLAAPSANISNTVSPTTANHVAEGIGNRIPYILDGGACAIGIESTIVTERNNELLVLREGGISQEMIQAISSLPVRSVKNSDMKAPGQLKKHYATRKPLYIVPDIEHFYQTHPTLNICYLSYSDRVLSQHTICLSKSYNLSEIANSLFSCMRKADNTTADCIVIEQIKTQGIGRAIADRLHRASTPLPDSWEKS